MNPYKKWAQKIAGLLTNRELDELALLLDEDQQDQFAFELTKLNYIRNPDYYGPAADSTSP